ncbi:MAG: VIT and VWA domain-containing protein [Candidatus Obscuribacterales bacterium]|nr:VIT and VWA domain-containing protein [Candidatus Obscuribacterales bacterium]
MVSAYIFARLFLFVLLTFIFIPTSFAHNSLKFAGSGSGSISVNGADGHKIGQCALKNTCVEADVSMYMAKVTVKQTFHNPYNHKIEAVYTFPLPEHAAVDNMRMTIGDRTIYGTIKTKVKAQKIYSQAKKRGYVSALLEQERPNIFRQNVANIEPGKEITVTLQYSDLLPYEGGRYTFAFPLVVGPRFQPEGSSFTNITYGASNLTAGHQVSIKVNLHSSLPISDIQAVTHTIDTNQINPGEAIISLARGTTIPNKDFVLSWQIAGESIKSSYLAHRTGKSGYLNLMLMPPKRLRNEDAAPKEMIFLIDRSGSQSGAPLAKAKETLHYILDHMNPQDTIQIIAFGDQVESAFDKPQAANLFTKIKAGSYIDKLEGNGGTWMGPAVEKVCSVPADQNRIRIVTFMTDGYVGNDFEILGLIRKLRAQSRWFSFGTGASVNRFLIDAIAREGGGEADYILLETPGDVIAKRFYERISTPVLTNVSLEFSGIEVKDLFPRAVSDVWSERPLYFKGRYTKAGQGFAKLKGFLKGKPYEELLPVVLPEYEPANAELPQVWARAAVEELTALDYFGMQNTEPRAEVKQEIIRLSLTHHILSQFTSFVAVDESVLTQLGEPIKETVPIEMPEGVSYEQIFGSAQKANWSSTIPPSSVNSSPREIECSGDDFGSYQSAPLLQGAVNGVIGPASSVVLGVNTAGTVKVRNTSNIRTWLLWSFLLLLIITFYLFSGGKRLSTAQK